MTEPKPGDTATCSQCGERIVFVGPAWDHPGAIKPRHIALPVEPKRQFTPDEIEAGYEQIKVIGQIAAMIDLDLVRAVVESMEHTDAVMPLLDPTGWMRIQKNAPDHRRFASAFLRFRGTIEELKAGER